MSALAGHLVYGGCLGVAFHLLEAPFGVPWLARTRAEAAGPYAAAKLLAATPALGAVLLAMLLTLLVVTLGA